MSEAAGQGAAEALAAEAERDAARIRAGERRALARAITLVESTRPEHRARARAILAALARSRPEGAAPALRVGLSGTPGVGKSTFIEALGTRLTAAGHRVAVLAVDPSSRRTGGSILGDKTRMPRLARDPNAFIRPSPSGGTLGGVGRRTREVIALVEAAGFDIVLVETVGVGQSETMVAEMTDIFVLLLGPGGGDELQGVKRGIMEIADLILVNKADGDLRAQALRTAAEYAGALRLLRRRPEDPEGWPRAMAVSARSGEGLDQAWAAVEELARWRRERSWFARRREAQALAWFREEVDAGLRALLEADPATRDLRRALEAEVVAGRMLPDLAAEELLARLARRLGTALPVQEEAAGGSDSRTGGA